ncbi:LacI family DNA-binding transcriptional regulator [Pseudonocardia nigra]|uniref:LacI family DNA-binding transcriptional regulator n=1 Tax=Pseudonocardia nigra TaxID=1921578 RepID=UPI001C606F6F|nr:LacI family DNA-binding transcriptional regulator [Pseudonocardia nigra]
MRATSRDVAALAGVSTTAVSFVFNGRADKHLSAETQARILAAAAELGYRPHAGARSMRLQRTAVLGVIADRIASSPFAGRVLQAALQAAWARQHLLLVIDALGVPEVEASAAIQLVSRQVDGALYAAMSLRRAAPPARLGAVPFVLVNCFDEQDRYPSVIPDERAGGRASAEILLAAGHRRILLLAGPAGDVAADLRVEGFRDAVRAAGLRLPRGGVRRTGWDIADGDRMLEALLRGRTPLPSGVACANDRVALGVMMAAARHGVRVPEDLSVVGYDDQESLADQVHPGLTTVALPHGEMGRVGVEVLLDAVTEGRPVTPDRTLLACPVVMRSSVAPAPTP